MSRQNDKWVLKRKITVYVGEGDCGSDLIEVLKNKELYDTREAAKAQSDADQATLLSAMRGNRKSMPENSGIINIGGLIFNADSIKCAKFDVRPAADWELNQLLGIIFESDEDDDEDAATVVEKTTIPNAQMVMDDDDEDDD